MGLYPKGGLARNNFLQWAQPCPVAMVAATTHLCEQTIFHVRLRNLQSSHPLWRASSTPRKSGSFSAMWNPTRLTRQRVSCELRGAFASYRYDIRLVLLIRHSIDELIKLVYVQSHHVLNTCKKIVLTLVQYTSVLMKIFSLKTLLTISKILLYELQIFHRLYARISAVDVQINEWTPEERGPNRTTYNKVAFLSFFHYHTHTHTHK